MRISILTLVVKSNSRVRREMKNTLFFIIYCSDDSNTENRTKN